MPVRRSRRTWPRALALLGAADVHRHPRALPRGTARARRIATADPAARLPGRVDLRAAAVRLARDRDRTRRSSSPTGRSSAASCCRASRPTPTWPACRWPSSCTASWPRSWASSCSWPRSTSGAWCVARGDGGKPVPGGDVILALVATAAALYAIQVVVGALQISTALAAWAVALHLALGALIWALARGRHVHQLLRGTDGGQRRAGERATGRLARVGRARRQPRTRRTAPATRRPCATESAPTSP